MNTDKSLIPFFKCPGGKRKLITTLLSHLPEDFESRNYSEVFIGGGALFLNLLNTNIPKFSINDFNKDTFSMWCSIKNDPDALNYSNLPNIDDYYAIRSEFNYFNSTDCPDRIKRFFYLNKNCFNGLIRYNMTGHFNSPAGKYNHIQFPNLELIKSIHNKISQKDVEITRLDFVKSIESKLTNEWFFYIDPPYLPKSPTSNFTSYTGFSFTLKDHEELVECLDKITTAGSKFLLSNAHTPKALELYNKYDIVEVSNLRTINSKVTKRGPVKEILVKNY